MCQKLPVLIRASKSDEKIKKELQPAAQLRVLHEPCPCVVELLVIKRVSGARRLRSLRHLLRRQRLKMARLSIVVGIHVNHLFRKGWETVIQLSHLASCHSLSTKVTLISDLVCGFSYFNKLLPSASSMSCLPLVMAIKRTVSFNFSIRKLSYLKGTTASLL